MKTEGWKYKPTSRKRHFFRLVEDPARSYITHESLCGKWEKRYDDYFRLDREDEHLENCKVCRRRLARIERIEQRLCEKWEERSKSPNPDCELCLGRGYIGRDVATNCVIECRCVKKRPRTLREYQEAWDLKYGR